MDEWDKIYQELSRRNWLILLLLSTASYFFLSSSFTLGVISGGFITIVNFRFLQSTISKAFRSEELVRTKKAVLIMKAFFRLSFLGGIIYLLITRDLVNPIGLTVGLSIIVFSIVSFGISNARKLSTQGVV